MAILADGSPISRFRTAEASIRWSAAQLRKFGITLILAVTASSRHVSALRLSDTAVTPSDCSMQNATVSEYERSLPSSVISVPCSVVMTDGTRQWPVAERICRARYAAVAGGTA